MKSLVFYLLFVTCTLEVIYAQDDKVVSEKKIYKKVDGRDLYVDIFHAKNRQQNPLSPAIAFFHGGGWIFGDPSEFYGACKRYADLGFTTFSFQYRLSVNEDGSYPHPDITLIECVKDARSAIRWLRENAEALQIDPNKIVCSGQSAGGQLAWSTALFDSINESTDDLRISPVPNALVLYSSNYNSMEPWIDMIFDAKRDQIWSVSPHHNLKKGLPPALAFHGTSDCTVLLYTVQFFAEKMRALGNPLELILLEGRDHYLGAGNEKYARYFDDDILEQTDEFLKKLNLMPPTR